MGCSEKTQEEDKSVAAITVSAPAYDATENAYVCVVTATITAPFTPATPNGITAVVLMKQPGNPNELNAGSGTLSRVPNSSTQYSGKVRLTIAAPPGAGTIYRAEVTAIWTVLIRETASSPPSVV